MVSCQKDPTRHAYAWQIGALWQDTLDIPSLNVYFVYADMHVFTKSLVNQTEHRFFEFYLLYRSFKVYHDINILFLMALVILMNHRMHCSEGG